LDALTKFLAKWAAGGPYDLTQLKFEPKRQLYPWFFAGIAGCVASSLVTFVIAYATMPKPKNFSVSEAAGADSGVTHLGLVFAEKPKELEFRQIVKRNLFNAEGGEQDAASNSQAKCEPKKSDLPLRFVAIIYGGKADSSLVVLESTSNKQADSFLLGDPVPGEGTISDIQRDKVFIERNECPEFLELIEPELPKKRIAGEKKKVAPLEEGKTGDGFREDGFERSGTAVRADRQWVEKALTVDFAKTLQDAKASPHTVDGQVKGFILSRIRPDSVYEKMGLQDGDVIEAINGIDLNDGARAVQTLNQMRKESNIELNVKRGATSMQLKVQIK
jgi:general secretion pathway protein C